MNEEAFKNRGKSQQLSERLSHAVQNPTTPEKLRLQPDYIKYKEAADRATLSKSKEKPKTQFPTHIIPLYTTDQTAGLESLANNQDTSRSSIDEFKEKAKLRDLKFKSIESKRQERIQARLHQMNNELSTQRSSVFTDESEDPRNTARTNLTGESESSHQILHLKQEAGVFENHGNASSNQSRRGISQNEKNGLEWQKSGEIRSQAGLER